MSFDQASFDVALSADNRAKELADRVARLERAVEFLLRSAQVCSYKDFDERWVLADFAAPPPPPKTRRKKQRGGGR